MKPVDMLVEPEAKGAIPSGADDLASIGDWLNVSHAVMKLAEWVTGVNPGQWAIDRITGDWAAYGKAGSAMIHLGEYYQAYGQALTEHKNLLMRSWQGHAAKAADAYFTKLADAVSAQQELLTKIGNELHLVAYKMWTMAKLADSLLETLLDYVLEAAVWAAIGAGTLETGVGPVVGWTAMALNLKRATGTWRLIIEVHDKTYNAFLASMAIIFALVSKVQSFAEHPLPQGAYDHPGV